MSNTKTSNKKPNYVDGVRLFKPNDNAPQNLLANVLITPRILIETLKQDEKATRNTKRTFGKTTTVV
jgi:hypothetical protein